MLTLLALLLTCPRLDPQTISEIPAAAQALGRGTRGASLPELELVGAPVVGNPFGFEIRNAPPGSAGFLILGSGVLPQDLALYAAKLYPAGGLMIVSFEVDELGRSGPIHFTSAVPVALGGAELAAQALLLDARALGGLAFTRAAHVRLGERAFRPAFPGTLLDMGVGFVGSITSGDFDGDGHVDIATSSITGQGNHATAFFGSRGGTFSEGVELPTPQAEQVVSADFDGDGRDDLAALQSPPPALAVHFGQDDRTFGPPVTTPTTLPTVARLATGDFDGDALYDVVGQIEGFGGGRTVLFRGNGNGTFVVEESTRTFELHDTGDMNGDGALDLVGRTGGSLATCLGDGNGAFTQPIETAIGTGDFALGVGDIDADGIPDVGLFDRNDPQVLVLLGHGDGTFASPQAFPSSFSNTGVVGDLNADGFADLVAVASTGAAVYWGRSGGTLSGPRAYETGQRTKAALATDLDGDGRDDLAVAFDVHLVNSPDDPGELHVLYSVGDARQSVPLRHSNFGNPGDILLADFDGDQILDYVTSAGVRFAQGLGHGRFAPPVGPSGVIGVIETADLDRDGDLDVVEADQVADAVLVFLGNGQGGFGQPTSVPAVNNVSRLAIGDLDGDELQDVVAFGNDMVILYGRGDGTFEPPLPLPAGSLPTWAVIADVTEDGIGDLLLTHELAAFGFGGLQVWRGDRDRDLTLHRSASLPDDPIFLTTEHLDGDGILDLVVVIDEIGAGSVLVLRGEGDGRFDSADTIEIAEPASHQRAEAEVADFDRDGLLDLAVSSRRGVEVLRGLGAMQFAAPRIYFGSHGGVLALRAADVDDDFLPDLVVAAWDDPFVFVFRNQLLRDGLFLRSVPSAANALRFR